MGQSSWDADTPGAPGESQLAFRILNGTVWVELNEMEIVGDTRTRFFVWLVSPSGMKAFKKALADLVAQFRL